MTKLTKDQKRTRDTLLAARTFNRRTMLKSAAAVGAVTLGFPMIVKDAFSSSGELNLLMWSDEFPDPVIPNFEKASGIKQRYGFDFYSLTADLPPAQAVEIDIIL